MKKKMTINKVLALCSAAMIVAAFTLNTVVQASTLYCQYASVAGGTGCQTGPGCPWYEPNTGITWSDSLTCGYDGNNLVYAQVGHNCGANANGGCCNNLDSQQHCPSAGQCPDTPGCKASVGPTGPSGDE